MSHEPHRRSHHNRRIMDEMMRWADLPDGEIDDDETTADEEAEIEELVERLLRTAPSASGSPNTRVPWSERVLRATLLLTGVAIVLGLCAGLLAIPGLHLVEARSGDTSCEVFVWYAYRRSLAYGLVSLSAGISGVSLLAAVVALVGPGYRSARRRLAVLASLLLVCAVASGEKERDVRDGLASLSRRSSTGDEVMETAEQRCRRVFSNSQILGW